MKLFYYLTCLGLIHAIEIVLRNNANEIQSLGDLNYDRSSGTGLFLSSGITEIKPDNYCVGTEINGEITCFNYRKLESPNGVLSVHLKPSGDILSYTFEPSSLGEISVKVSPSVLGSKPTVKFPEIKKKREEGGNQVEEEENKTFLQKYWMYLIPILLLLTFGGGGQS